MRWKLETAVSLFCLLAATVIPWCTAAGQDSASLLEQLQAQYKSAKIRSDSNGPTVIEEGTVLAVQKGGILGVPWGSMKACSAKYENATLTPPSNMCAEGRGQSVKHGLGMLKSHIPGGSAVPDSKTNSDTRYFKKGEKVYPATITVDLKNEKIAFGVVACDTCNKTDPPTYFKAEVDFQFAPGYLEKGDVGKIEDTIGEVFQLDNGGGDAQQGQGDQSGQAQPADQGQPAGQGQDQGQAQAAAPAAAAPAAPAGPSLSNEDIVKLVHAKLPDSVIIKKINNSNCAFDTDPDALIKLKQAGVSEAVIDAMVDKK